MNLSAVRPLIKLELAEKTSVLPVSDERKPMIPDFKVLGHWLTFQGGVSRSRCQPLPAHSAS